ncbi:MAG: glycine cleavage system protein R [Rhodospirillales bacterium]
MQTNRAMISVLAGDRVGLVADITGCLNDMGLNLGDASFAVLGASAKFTAISEVPEEVSLGQLEWALRGVDGLTNATLSVTPYGGEGHGPQGRVTHRIILVGGDRPGLVARLCEVLVQYQANIVTLTAQSLPGAEGGTYAVRFEVNLPAERAQTCLATMANTASELRMTCDMEAV